MAHRFLPGVRYCPFPILFIKTGNNACLSLVLIFFSFEMGSAIRGDRVTMVCLWGSFWSATCATLSLSEFLLAFISDNFQLLFVISIRFYIVYRGYLILSPYAGEFPPMITLSGLRGMPH